MDGFVSDIVNTSFYLYGYPYYYNLLEYTPIVIDYKPFIMDANNVGVFHKSKKGKPNYTMRITPPRTAAKGINQYITDSVVIPIMPDGTFRYKLKPSKLYLPNGRYRVEFFRRGNRIPLDIQEWSIPAMPKNAVFAFTVNTDAGQVQLPMNIWNITAIDPVVQYSYQYNNLSFLNTEVNYMNMSFKVNYEPALTLDRILDYNTSNLNTYNSLRIA